MQLPLPLIKNVVLVGGGHAHALLLKKWAMKPVVGVRVGVNPPPTAPYTGMLPGHIAGHYDRDELDIDLVRLGQFADARLVLGAVTGLDRQSKTVILPGRPPIPYDVCSINVDITSMMPGLPGFAEHAVAAKPLDGFAVRWAEFVDQASGGPLSVVVIGGEVGGCELALAMQHRLRTIGATPNTTIGATPNTTIVDANEILAELGERSRT